nr:hypothetical protein CFP56_63780 [Quercus suber]
MAHAMARMWKAEAVRVLMRGSLYISSNIHDLSETCGFEPLKVGDPRLISCTVARKRHQKTPTRNLTVRSSVPERSYHNHRLCRPPRTNREGISADGRSPGFDCARGKAPLHP